MHHVRCVDALALLPLGSAAFGHELISLGVIAWAWLLFLPALPPIARCILLLSLDVRPDMGGASLFSLLLLSLDVRPDMGGASLFSLAQTL